MATRLYIKNLTEEETAELAAETWGEVRAFELYGFSRLQINPEKAFGGSHCYECGSTDKPEEIIQFVVAHRMSQRAGLLALERGVSWS